MNDLRHAFRQLAKTPGFTLLAVLSLAVGIGINSTLFSAMDAAFLRPLPVKQPEEIVKFERPMLTLAEYEQTRAELKSFTGVLASSRTNVLLKGSERLETIRARAVSANYFSVLGVAPATGRFFSERSPHLREPIVVLSHALWQRSFGGDPTLVGQTITLKGQPWTVVGVAPRGFTGEERIPATDIWYPATARPDELAGSRRSFLLLGRLAPGCTPEQAHAEVVTMFAAPEWQSLGMNRLGERVRVVSEFKSRMDHGGRATFLMGPVVGLVLLVACANVSCLLLGRYEERRREIAVRLALGAGRWRVMRYLLAEALLLSLAGAAGGLLLTTWSISVIPSVLPATLASWAPDVQIDERVLGLTLGLAFFSTLAFGLMPAWRASRLDVSTMLKTEGVHLGKTPSRNVLVVTQVMIATVFLALAALFVRGFLTGMNRDCGFTERNVLIAHLAPERPINRDTGAILDDIRQTIAALPGVRRVTFANTVLGGGTPMPVRAPDDESTGNAAGRPVPCNAVDPGYFAALGISLLKGRDFTAHDGRGSGLVVIVNETLAKQFWPGAHPVGQTLFAGRRGLQPREVVGVVRDVIDPGARDPRPQPALYAPFRQEGSGSLLLVVNAAKPAADLAAPIREALRRMDDSIQAFSFDTVDGRLRVILLPQWFGAWLGGVLGVLAFLLAVSGLFGVVAYAVARRTHELGVRIALGAGPRDALWLVQRQGIVLAAIGVLLGVPLAIGAASVMRSLLVGISPTDPFALGGAALLVIAVASLATYLPARRATRISPMDALRAQ